MNNTSTYLELSNDADLFLIGKKEMQQDSIATSSDNASSDVMLSFIDLLAHYNNKLDHCNYSTNLSNCIDRWLQAETKRIPDIMPYITIVDLNNGEDTKFENQPKRAIEIGITGSF